MNEGQTLDTKLESPQDGFDSLKPYESVFTFDHGYPAGVQFYLWLGKNQATEITESDAESIVTGSLDPKAYVRDQERTELRITPFGTANKHPIMQDFSQVRVLGKEHLVGYQPPVTNEPVAETEAEVADVAEVTPHVPEAAPAQPANPETVEAEQGGIMGKIRGLFGRKQ